MPDKIQLLSDHVANQIAAGEVIQRPASAVKELMENAVDAGATEIKLLVKDAGKALVQVVDNGSGMSQTDARMAFERHATSKIRKIEDLFHIRTMGFRGEALASIAAVAQVEVKTRRAEDELGTFLEIENSEVTRQEPCSCPVGTSIAMKNLFFSVPARRNFLKSNPTELRHIIKEFTHVSLPNPHIVFTMETNGQELYHLPKGNIKQRIIQFLGQSYQDKLVKVNEETEYLKVSGYVGKPEAAKKTRGDQYLFVNGRYIKSAYINHAIAGAFEELMAKDRYPLYVLFIELDAAEVDINVHPTKQEIKFEDEKVIYAFIRSAVKHALARFSITPTLDFELNKEIQQMPSITRPFSKEERERTRNSDIYRSFTQKNQSHRIGGNEHNLQHWQDLYPKEGTNFPILPSEEDTEEAEDWSDRLKLSEAPKKPVQIHRKYILQHIKSGFILMDQQAAHERILYEQYQNAFKKQALSSQQSLFPELLELSPEDTALLEEMLPELKVLGYDIQKKGPGTFAIHGVPADLDSSNEGACIEELLEQFKHFTDELKPNKRERVIQSLAHQHAIKPGKELTPGEMQNIIDRLFACEQSQISPSGQFTFIPFRMDELDKMFGR